jgi:hypothetical protein
MVGFSFLAVFLVVAGIEPGSLKRSENRSLIATLLVLVGIFFVAILLSPRDLELLLNSTIYRFLLETWPLFVFITLVLARLPGITRQWDLPPD